MIDDITKFLDEREWFVPQHELTANIGYVVTRILVAADIGDACYFVFVEHPSSAAHEWLLKRGAGVVRSLPVVRPWNRTDDHAVTIADAGRIFLFNDLDIATEFKLRWT